MAGNKLLSLKDRIEAALTNPDSELWFPNLICDLAQSGLERLFATTELTEFEYGTARIILKDVGAARIGQCGIFPGNEIFLEFLPAAINEKYKQSGVEFYTREEVFSNAEILNCVNEAFKIISQVPSLYTSVCSLVRSIHLIKPEDDEYDVSFSEPFIPFSIFVSVPKINTPINALRMAEAIVHEAMHLQLTLIENIVELVVPGGKLVYSPWKEEYRTAQGILHAIYVFRVITEFYNQISHYLSSRKYKNYLFNRQKLISEQVALVSKFELFSDLTEYGIAFTNRLTANQS